MNIKELKAKAEAGDAEAQCDLGYRYYYAVKYTYCSLLGHIYYRGDEAERDYKKAFKWYTKAAKQNHPKAQCRLGDLYYYGDGVKQDYKKAFKWFKKAADDNFELGKHSIGHMYYYGRGVKQNKEEAYKWIKLEDAKNSMDYLKVK